MKRPVAMILALMFALACIIPVGALAAGSPVARVEGVDYSRVEENKSLQKKVTFTFGGRSFTGTLSNGKTLTEAEVDAIIKEVMSSGAEKPITSGMLIGAQQRMSEALKYDEGRYIPPRVLLELMLSGSGVQNAEQLSNILTGAENAPKLDSDLVVSTITGTALGKLFDMALGYITGSATIVTLAGWLKSTSDIAVREYMEYVESDEKAQEALAAALALEEFYALVNARIKKAEKEKGTSTWSIKCAQTVWTKKSLLGVDGIMQFWRLTCDLKRTGGPDDPMNWGGTYTGSMKLDIWHDMSAFDEAFLSKFYLSPSLPFAGQSSMFTQKDNYSQSSILTKTLTNPIYTVVLDPGMAEAGSLEKPMSFAGFNDRTFFWSMHPIRAGLDIGVFSDGNMHASGGGASVNATLVQNHTFVGELAGDNRTVYIDVYSWNFDDFGTYTAPYVGSGGYDYTEGGISSMTIASDSQIFDDLRIVPTISVNAE